MEKGPKFRVVGNAPDEEKGRAVKNLENYFSDNFDSLPSKIKEIIRSKEVPKTKEDLAAIDFANRETDRLMEECGVAPYDIPSKNYYFIWPDIYKKSLEAMRATPLYNRQMILFDPEFSKRVVFASDAFHETLHLKGHFAIEVKKNEEDDGRITVSDYRAGVTTSPSQKNINSGENHFLGLHEAIVSTQEKKSFNKILELPEFAEEKKWWNSELVKEVKKEISNQKFIPEEEIMWIDEDGYITCFSYPSARKTFDYVCEEIQKEFPEKYKDKDEVLKEFLKAHFTGHLLEIGRLVEKTFGKGSFRVLGEMGADDNSGRLTMAALSTIKSKKSKDKI